MTGIESAAAEAVFAKVADAAITALLAGIERGPIVDHVRALEAKGAKPDDITDSLLELARASAERRRAAIAGAPE